MLSKHPFLTGGLALIATACAMPQPGLRRTTPIDHTLLRGEPLHTERQILEGREINLLTAFGNPASLENRNLTLHLSSILEAPEVNGKSLRIVRLLQENNVLIVAYASPDASGVGALALVDISRVETPQLRAELQLPTVDLETMAVDGRQVYFTGLSSDSGRSIIGRISFQDFEWQDDLKIQALDVKSVASLAVLDDRLVVLDREGSKLVGLQKKDFANITQVMIPGLSQLGQDAAELWTLSREPADIRQLDSELQQKSRIPSVAVMKDQEFSGSMQIGQETIMAALGGEGIRAFCKADRKALFNIPAVIRADLEPARTSTLSAALSHGLLLTANADAGVYLYQVLTHDKQGACRERELRFEGYLDLGKQFRAESLIWQRGVLSVADGQGRLNVFSIESEDLGNDDTDFDG